jgi:hypothetical protein
MDEPTLERFADLAVGFGANVQPDQIVAIGCEPGKEYLTRALTASAYRHGAKFVDIGWFDPYVKRARVEHGRPETLDFVPDWYGKRVLALGDVRAARVALSGPSVPGLLADLEPALVGKDRLPSVKEGIKVVNDRTTNWTIVPCPTRPWAEHVFPDLEPDEAWDQLSYGLNPSQAVLDRYGIFSVYVAKPGHVDALDSLLRDKATRKALERDARGVYWELDSNSGTWIAYKRYAGNVVLVWFSESKQRALDDRWENLDGVLADLAR